MSYEIRLAQPHLIAQLSPRHLRYLLEALPEYAPLQQLKRWIVTEKHKQLELDEFERLFDQAPKHRGPGDDVIEKLRRQWEGE